VKGENIDLGTLRLAEEQLARTGFDLLLKEPFYAHLLGTMPRKVTQAIDTAAISWDGNQVVIQINPDFFLNKLKTRSPIQTDNLRMAVIKHLLLHVVFRHLFRQADRNEKIYDLAADLVVNQLVSPLPLPDGFLTLDDFPELNLEPDQTLDYYYEKLQMLLNKMSKPGGKDDQPGDESSEGSDWEQTGAPKSASALSKYINSPASDDHGSWSDGSNQLHDNMARHAVEGSILTAKDRTSTSAWGSMPAQIMAQLSEIQETRQPKLDWKRALRIFCAATGKTRIRHTVKRVSKRFGTRPGVKIQRFQRLLIAIDTSGSVDDEMLDDFFTEIHGIWQAGASVTIVECDAEIHRNYEYTGKPPKTVEGRGGTEFEPVFQWMQQQRCFDGLLYLTDGYAPAPTTPPSCRMLWVVPEDCAPDIEELPFGNTLSIPKNL
jgi:predicted metal-dependent peptidase